MFEKKAKTAVRLVSEKNPHGKKPPPKIRYEKTPTERNPQGKKPQGNKPPLDCQRDINSIKIK